MLVIATILTCRDKIISIILLRSADFEPFLTLTLRGPFSPKPTSLPGHRYANCFRHDTPRWTPRQAAHNGRHQPVTRPGSSMTPSELQT